jgi:radical SAM/Cys-rich protein
LLQAKISIAEHKALSIERGGKQELDHRRDMQSFKEKIKDLSLDLTPLSITTLQVNITKLCNQACHHCHVDSSPKRRETLSDRHLDKVLTILAQNPSIEILDITGGAPELHPKFRTLVKQARLLGKRVMVRHNLTVTFDPHPQTKESMRDIPAFFKEQGVEVISSLPYYREYLTDKQRGSGVFKKSIEALKVLNQQGFGREKNLILNLVYNPVGRYLPGPQENLEKEYKRELKKTYEIDFNQLFVLTNMPIHRFKKDLIKSQQYEDYMEKLHSAFNPVAGAGSSCGGKTT